MTKAIGLRTESSVQDLTTVLTLLNKDLQFIQFGQVCIYFVDTA